MDEPKHKHRAVLVLLILGSVVALIATWHAAEDNSGHTQE